MIHSILLVQIQIVKKKQGLPGGGGGGGFVTTDVVTIVGGGPQIVVAVDMPVPETMITFGVSGRDFACDEDPRVVDDAVRVTGNETADECTDDEAPWASA